MRKLPLTIVTAVLNEEKILPSFLEHIKNFANEVIVIVDYRNTDRSVDVARKFGCKVLIDKGESGGIVFNNKNRGIEDAKYNWILILDADERLDHILRREIRSVVLGRYRRQSDIYQTSFLNYEFGKIFDKSDQKNKPFVRLFRKGAFSYSTEDTSEGFGIQTSSLAKHSLLGKIVLKIPLIRSWYLNKVSGIVTLKGHLVHLSHPTIKDFIAKIDHYSTREALILFKKNPSTSDVILLIRIIFSPIKEFIYKFFLWQLYKEGIHGYIASVIYGFYYFLINAKYFRFTYKKKNRKKIRAIGKKYDFKGL